MTEEQLNHMLAQMQAQVRQDTAMAELLHSRATQEQMMLDTILLLHEENQHLREQLHTTHIENFNGTLIETVNQANICQPSSAPSTEPISNTSTPTSKINIMRLHPEK